MTRVVLLDMTDNWETDVTLADDVPVREVLSELLRALGLPTKDPGGEKISYGICIDGQPNMLNTDRTLRENNVWDGSRLRLLAGFTAH